MKLAFVSPTTHVNTPTLQRGSRIVYSSSAAGPPAARIAIIIPACNEEVCIGPVLEELLTVVDPDEISHCGGVNNSSIGPQKSRGNILCL